MLKDNKTNEIIATIAHQWRQPLSQINATVCMLDKLLYDKHIQDPQIEEKLQEIEKLTKYMSNTIDEFKRHFENSAKMKTVVLQDVIQEALEPLQTYLKESNIKLECNINHSYQLSCYADELKQIIMVLINNAKDALLDRNIFDATIVIRLFQLEQMYCIEVRDNAGGISKSVMGKIFDPYYTTKHHSTGTGLGLFMARKIIEEKHNGTLNAQNVDKGSSFTIALPF